MHLSIVKYLLVALLSAVSCQEESTLPAPNLQTTMDEQYPDWEYEPRIWLTEEDLDYQEGDELERNDSVDQLAFDDVVASLGADNPRKSHHFVGIDIEGDIKKASSSNKQQAIGSDNKEPECTQFRADTRDAVICDKKRCDKLTFEWPKFDNQLALIETTKHGMRFHRVDLAFATQKGNSRDASSRLNERRQSVDDKVSAQFVTPQSREKSRGKFDIFELFKPKPSSTTPSPQTPTLAPETPPTTATPKDNNGSTRPEDDSNISTITSSTDDREANNQNQDANTTQLIPTFRLDTRRTKQKIVGFGGALSDSTCRNIKSLSAQMAKSLMEDYYGDKGIRYNIARLTMGSSDFSTTPYTNNDAPTANKSAANQRFALSQEDDVEMNNFRLTDEDYEFKLPIARQAMATSHQGIKFFSSMWSPPIWMKNNSNIVHGYLKGDVYGPYYKALAELMLKWLEAYKKNGIEFWATTGLNEPITGIKPFITHNSLGISREDYVTFFKLYLGPMLRQRGFQDVKILMLDDNKGYAPQLVKAMFSDREAAKYVSGVAVHWYMNDEYENLNFISKDYPEKFIIATEACNGYLPFQVHALPGNWDRGVAYAYDIIKLLQKNSVGWVDWNMALDLSGGPTWAANNLDAAIIVNAKRDEYYKSPMFYAIGHFSRFVEPESLRLDHRLANARFDYPLEAVAFYTPNKYITIVALNANKHPVPFKIVVDKQLIRVVTLRGDSFNTIVFKWKSN